MQYLTKDEIKRLVLEIPDYRKRLIVLIGYYHALRVSEILGLTGKDIQDGYISVQRLKGSLKTVQPFIHSDDPVMDEAAPLAMLAKTTGLKEKLFSITRNGVYKLFQRAGKRAGLPAHKCHPHVLKHSCLMTIIPTGIENARQYGGHKSISSTGYYLKVSDEAASKAVAGMFT